MKITTRLLNRNELHLVRQVADEVWPVTFREILSPEQIVYMMEMMYAPEVMEREYAEGIRFNGVFDGEKAVGYYIWGACKEVQGGAKLHKCYLLTEYHCSPLLLLPSIFPSIKVFSGELALHIR